MFQQFFSKRLNRTIRILGVSCIAAIAIPIAAITVSRFGNMGGGIAGFLNWYVGQGSLYFNNFALDAGGTRNGDRTLNLAKRLIDPDTPKTIQNDETSTTTLILTMTYSQPLSVIL